MNKVRFRYVKEGKAKYISHLDLMSTLQRSFRRAGIDLKYSEGFNPHPYMSVALPLSVGCESVCELIDVSLAGIAIPDISRLELPEGLSVVDAYTPLRSFNDIVWIEIIAELQYTDEAANHYADRLRCCLNKDIIVISKRTKRGYKDIDIAPFIKDAEIIAGRQTLFKAKISAQNPTINTSDLLNVFDEEIKPENIDIRRVEIYDRNMIIFK